MIIFPREIKAILAFTSSNKKMLNFYRQFMLTAKLKAYCYRQLQSVGY